MLEKKKKITAYFDLPISVSKKYLNVVSGHLSDIQQTKIRATELIELNFSVCLHSSDQNPKWSVLTHYDIFEEGWEQDEICHQRHSYGAPRV